MKIISQHYEILKPDYTGLETQDGLVEFALKQIEEAAKNCYQSCHNIKDGSAKPFVEGLIKAKHFAPLEFGPIYLSVPMEDCASVSRWTDTESLRQYSRFCGTIGNECFLHVSTTYRVIAENGLFEDLKYICQPTPMHTERTTVKLVTNRQVMSEITRHRKCSFCIESTRYNNYSKGKYGNELVYIKPCWLDNEKVGSAVAFIEGTMPFKESDAELEFAKQCKAIESFYLGWLSNANGLDRAWSSQEAAAVLPNSLKCTIYMSAFNDDWKHVLALRTSTIAETGQPHPMMADLFDKMIREEPFVKLF